MPVTLKKDIVDLGGGRNGGIPAARIGESELAECVNLFPYGPVLRRRPGSTRDSTVPYTEKLTSMFAHKTRLGQWIEFFGGLTSVARLDAGVLSSVPQNFVIPESYEPWRARQYKDVTYAVREGLGYLTIVARPDAAGNAILGLLPAGLHAHTSGPAVSLATALPAADLGIAAGTYGCVVTPYNANTGQEGNPSPETSVVVAVGKSALHWQVTATYPYAATDGQQVTHFRCYRSLKDTTGAYYFVGSIAYDGTLTQTLDEGKDVGQLGVAASFKNTVPPTGVVGVESWGERGWLHDGRYVYYSELGLFESYPAANAFPVYPDDGHQIKVVYRWGDSRLVVGKTNGIHFIEDSGSGFLLQTLTDRYGCPSPDSMRTAEGNLFWFSGNDFHLSDGNAARAISDPQVRDMIDDMSAADRRTVHAAIEPKRGWYLASIAIDGVRARVLCYDYRRDRWTVFKWSTVMGTPYFMGDHFHENQLPITRAVTTDGHVYTLFVNTATDDAGNAISWNFTTKAFGFEMEALRKGVRRVNVLTNAPSPTTLTMKLLVDGAIYKSRDIDLAGNLWRRANLSNLKKLGRLIQFRLLGSDAASIDIEGLSFELVGFARMERAA